MPHRDVWVTGACLVSSVADGAEEHWTRLQRRYGPLVVEHGDTGLLVHPLLPLDFSSEISNPMDRKRMGQLQALGVYTAGRALTSAGLKGRSDFLSRTAVVVGCAGGERDIALDETIFSEAARFSDAALLNQKLSARMRPVRSYRSFQICSPVTFPSSSESRAGLARPWVRNWRASTRSRSAIS